MSQCATLYKKLLYRKYMRFINQLYILLYIVCESVCTSSKQNSYIFIHMNITSTSHRCLKLPVMQLDCSFNRLLRQISMPAFLTLCERNQSVTDGSPHKKPVKTAPVPGPLWGKSIGDRWFPVTKGQWRRKHFHIMMLSRYIPLIHPFKHASIQYTPHDQKGQQEHYHALQVGNNICISYIPNCIG